MLIQEQSSEKLIEKLEKNDSIVVVIISPNSRASIASYFNIPVSVLFLKLCTLFKSLGVQYVLDAACGGDVALMESREEFLFR
jgi:iron only hydrogenase large subunit-like protein